MQRLQLAIKELNEKPNFPELRSLAFDADTLDLTIELQHPPPCSTVMCRLTQEYIDNYPIGSLSMMVGDSFHVIPHGENKLPAMTRHIHDLCQLTLNGTPSTYQHSQFPKMDSSEGMGMGEPTTSWLREGTVEIAAVGWSGSNEGEGSPPAQHAPGLNPQILADIESVQGGHGVVLNDQPIIDKAIIVISIDLKPIINKLTAEAWNLVHDQPLELRLMVDRGAYLDGSLKIDVGQAHHFRTGINKGLVGQLQRILQVFLESGYGKPGHEEGGNPLQTLVDFGFDEPLAKKALALTKGDNMELAAKLLTEYNEEEFENLKEEDIAALLEHGGCERIIRENEGDQTSGVERTKSILAKKLPPSSSHGFLDRLVCYAIKRIPSVPEFCVICDRPHVFAGGNMLQAAVSTRELCLFRFQQLEVATGIVDNIAVQTGVIDLLVTCAKAAVKSSRWELIFNPFPLVFGPEDSKKPVLNPEEKNHSLAQQVLAAIPSMKDLSGASSALDLKAKLDLAHPLAYPTFNWIVNSNRTHLVQIPQEDQIECMGTPLQFIMISQAPELQNAFLAKKKQYGYKWAFHGSRAENWHSILRNGLKNASGTKLQVNGTAHGHGIYLSPAASVSFGYSQISTGKSSGKAVSDLDKKYLDLDSMHCIAVAEAVEQDIKKSGNIWVQKYEDCVQTRFFFVYQHGHSHGCHTDLTNPETAKQFDDAAKKFGLS